MPKIVMLNVFYYPYQGGTEEHLRHVSEGLVQKGYDVSVVCCQSPGTKPGLEVINGVKVIRVKAFILKNTPALIPPPVPIAPGLLDAIIDEVQGADIVHIHNRFFFSFLDIKKLKRKYKCKFAITLHNAKPHGIEPLTDVLGGAYDDLVGSRIISACDLVAAVSKDTLKTTCPKGYRGKKAIFYNAVDTSYFKLDADGAKFRAKLKIEDKKVILFVGRLMPQKGIEYLIDAMPLVKQKVPNAHLVVHGWGPLLKTLQKRATQVDKGSITVLFDPDFNKDRRQIFASCDVFCAPSLWEPFGLVLIEAMACGKPIVSSKVGGIPEIVDSTFGVLVKPKDVKGIANALIYILRSNTKQLGLAARKVTEKRFIWPNTVAGYDTQYRALLK